jgi:hypothetical protein
MRKLLLGGLGAVVILGFGLAVLTYSAATAVPIYPIPDQKLELDYAKQIKGVGIFKLATIGAPFELPIVEENTVFIYVSLDGKYPVRSEDEMFIQVTKQQSEVDKILQSIRLAQNSGECGNYNQTTAAKDDWRYYIGFCGTARYYIYQKGNQAIYFNVNGSEAQLQALIEEYVKL